MKRADDFEARSGHLKNLTDAELEQRFWSLAEELVNPMLKLGYENTTPSVERSVLLRMGFSSIEAKSIVDACVDHRLIGHGAGNVVYKIAKRHNLPIREAGLALANGEYWDEAETLFNGGNV